MAVEPLQDVIRLVLEAEGYFVRSNARFRVEGETKSGRTAAYADLDILALKVAPGTGLVVDRLWAEMKAHLTSSLTAGYLRGFASDFATMLGDAAWLDEGLLKKHGETGVKKFQHRQRLARECAESILGPGYKWRLYFGGRKPQDGGEGAKALLHPDLEVVYVRDLLGDWIGRLTHLEGNEEFVRIINVLAEYGLLRNTAADPPAS